MKLTEAVISTAMGQLGGYQGLIEVIFTKKQLYFLHFCIKDDVIHIYNYPLPSCPNGDS